MTPDAADALAKRIVNVWRGGPNLTEWRDELQRLDEGQAGTTFARLKRTQEHAPSIARFIAEYRALETSDGSTTEHCADCGGSGWVEAPPFVKAGRTYTAVKPCQRCRNGQQAAESRTWTNRGAA